MARHRTRRRLGQHFLHDQVVIDRIIAAAAPEPGQPFIEIGPGKGALTLPLLQRLGRLQVVELDPALAGIVAERCAGYGELRVHCTDALTFDFSRVSDSRLRVIGNLPYRISTPLIFHLLDYHHCVRDMLFMLQKEVVERLTARPGSRTYGRLSVMVQARCQVEKLFTVAAGAFSPPPRVESAVVRLVPGAVPGAGIKDVAMFSRVVRLAFNQRRKTLRNALRGLLTEQQIRNVGIEPRVRPEQLTVSDFAALANACYPGGQA